MPIVSDIRRAWAPQSRMAGVALQETEANRLGRERVVDGVLTASPKTRHLTPRDFGREDVIVQPGFLTGSECDRLLRVFDALHERVKGRRIGIDFWEGRIVYLGDVRRHDPEGAAIMADFQRRTTSLLEDFYALTRPLYADTVQLNVWAPGACLPPHTDNSNGDGSRHPSYWRDFSSVVYLNDDYEGGELYFTAKDAVLKPRRGMLAAFSAYHGHEHGVLRVERGRRITMPAFYTFWPAKADPLIYPELFGRAPQAAALKPGAAALHAQAPRWTPPRQIG